MSSRKQVSKLFWKTSCICSRNEQRLQQHFRRQPFTAPSTATSAGNCFSVSVNPSQGYPVIQGLPVMPGLPIIQAKPVVQEQPIAQGGGNVNLHTQQLKGPTSINVSIDPKIQFYSRLRKCVQLTLTNPNACLMLESYLMGEHKEAI